MAKMICSHVGQSSRNSLHQNGVEWPYLISLQHSPILKLQPVPQHLLNLLALLDLDLPINDQLTTSHINIIPASALKVLHKQPRPVRAPVQLEPSLRQSLQRLPIILRLQLGHLDLDRLQHRPWRAVHPHIPVLARRAVLVVQARERDLGDALAGHDAGRRALHHGDVVALLVEILRDVVSAVAAAHDDGLLLPAGGVELLGAGELGGVAESVAFEVGDAFDVRGEAGFAAVAGGLDDVLWVQGPMLGGAVFQGAVELDGPVLRGIGPGGLGDGCASPDVEFKGLGVRLEPRS